MSAEKLITDHIDLWTSTVKAKSTQGRGSSKKRELYGITKLRELILELAVRGKLVPQDPNDEPASVLLERIAAEKSQLIKDKTIKKQKPLPPISEEENLFEIPERWAWARLGEICDTRTGYAFKSGQYTDDGTFVLRVTNIEASGKIVKADNKFIDPVSANTTFSKFLLEEDDILLVMVGGSLGKIGAVSNEDLPAVLNQNMWKFIRYGGVLRDYFIYGLKLINTSQITITKSTHGHLSQGEYLSKNFPLPPLNEQHRIVAKVDELMTLCDQLEQQTETSLDAHNLLVDTLLATLTDAQDAAELSDNWARFMATDGRYAGNAGAISGSQSVFDTLITTDYAVEQLKQTILQLAVQGKLVPQDPKDEPASELLKRIAAEKEQLIKDKKIKKQKPLREISEEEKPFELPAGWALCHLRDIMNVLNGRAYKKHEMLESGTPLLRVGNLFTSKQWFYSDIELEPEKYIDNGDLIYAWSASFGPFVWDGGKVIYHYHIWKLDQYHEPSVNKFYLFNYLQAITASIKASGNGIAMVHMTKERMEKIALPIAPLAEQHRIVAKVDELMAHCDQLKANLQQAQTTQLHIADAITEQALA